MFRNSVTPQRQGHTVNGKQNVRVVRFNSYCNVFEGCDSDKCTSCSMRQACNDKKDDKGNAQRMKNDFNEFCNAVNEFFDTAIKFCEEQITYYSRRDVRIRSIGSKNGGVGNRLKERLKRLTEANKTVSNWLSGKGKKGGFTIPFAEFQQMYQPIKCLYWDTVAMRYIKVILDRFYAQCDSVLSSAELFERFVKTFSIAEFMKNMEERNDTK